MEFIVVIPARYGSSRLPNKVLCDVSGKTMLQRVWEQAEKSNARRIIIATDDERVETVAREFGGEVRMTAIGHQSGSDRINEIAGQLLLEDTEIIVNVQGDEPLIPPDIINQVANNLDMNPKAGVATLSIPIVEIDDFLNPNVVKVVVDDESFALFFSRAPIPWPRNFGFSRTKLSRNGLVEGSRHVGLYAYRVNTLRRFVNQKQSKLEKTERLEQLRFMAHGVKIHVERACCDVPHGVDTKEDLLKINKFFRNLSNQFT